MVVPTMAVFLLRPFTSKREIKTEPDLRLTLEQDSSCVTALSRNMRIAKFKSQLTIAFFAAVNHLNGPLRKQNFTLTGSKGHGL